ncbi:hypothetical protein Tco_1312520 [Tanacetum coccineum]
MDLIAYSDSDYAGASIDRKSTTREAEYIAASHCCGQVLWLQNQLLDYGYNFMRTKIHIDNKSTIIVIKNPVSHSKTKHIEIRFHFIRDSYEKKLIEMVKIHTDNNVADLLTKAFDVTREEFNDGMFLQCWFNHHTTNGHQFTMSNRLQELASPKQTALLEFYDKHNMVAYLVKSESSEGFDEIIDFLTSSHIYYALTENPIIFVSLIEQFWETTVLSTTEEGLQAISATIDGHEKLITEASLRRHLKLEDAEGISSLTNEEIFEQLTHMGSKKTTWDQFSSNIATAIICLATSRRFNFSKFIFEAMVKNLDSPHKFLLYPSTTEEGLQAISVTIDGHEQLITEASLRIHLKLEDAKGISLLSNEEIFEQLAHMGIDGLEKDLQQTKKTYSTALTKLVLRVKKLEYKLKSGKARRKAKIVLSDDEEIAEDSSKQGRKISQIDEDPTISLVQDEGISWIPQEEEVHEKPSDETEVIVQEETPTEIIEEHGSGEKGEMEISTASPPKVTKVSTAEAHVYTRRSAKDKGKAIMEEPATPKKVKKRTQVQLSMDEELARKMEEEERARFNAEQEARALQEEDEERLNLEAAWELQRQLDERQQNKPVSIAQARRNMITYLKNQGGYKESYFKRMSYNDIRPIFERVWDHVNTFIPIGSEVEKGKPDPVMIEKKAVGTRRKTLARRRASDKQVEDNSKRQKKEKESDDFEQEKEDLRMWLSVFKDEEESLLGRMEMKDIEVYKLTRADGTVSFHGGTKSLFRRLDRDDLKVLYKLVQERFEDHSLEEKELILWGDLRMMFDPDEQDEIWKNQESWKYPLKKEILEKMINLKLQAEEESTMAFELIKFTRSQIEEK